MSNLQPTMDDLPNVLFFCRLTLEELSAGQPISAGKSFSMSAGIAGTSTGCILSLLRLTCRALAIVDWNVWSGTAERRSNDLFNESSLAPEGQSQAVTLRAQPKRPEVET